MEQMMTTPLSSFPEILQVASRRVQEDTMDLNVSIDMNMAWLLPIGFTLGALAVVAFDYKTLGFSHGARRTQYKDLTGKKEVPESVDERLGRWVDGPSTMGAFWGGSVLRPEVKHKKVFAKNYEVLALLQALLFSVSVTFYVESGSSDMLGAVCCLGCCAFWMGTLSSAFLSVAVSTLETEEQFRVLVGLYGDLLMAVPMILLVWGSLMLFFQLVIFFKTEVDENMSYVCLAVCFLVAPLFFHAMHKLSWVHEVIKADSDVDKEEARSLLPEEIHHRLMFYIESKGKNVMGMDRQEFLDTLKGPKIKSTSAQQVYAEQLFDQYLEAQLALVQPVVHTTSLVGLSKGNQPSRPKKQTPASSDLNAKKEIPTLEVCVSV